MTKIQKIKVFLKWFGIGFGTIATAFVIVVGTTYFAMSIFQEHFYKIAFGFFLVVCVCTITLFAMDMVRYENTKEEIE